MAGLALLAALVFFWFFEQPVDDWREPTERVPAGPAMCGQASDLTAPPPTSVDRLGEGGEKGGVSSTAADSPFVAADSLRAGGSSPPPSTPPPPPVPADFERGPFAVWREGDNAFRVVFTLPDYTIVRETVAGGDRRRILADGRPATIRVVGKPELPAYRADFRVPPGMAMHLVVEDADRVAIAYENPLLSQGFIERRETGGDRFSAAFSGADGDLFPELAGRITTPYQIGSSRGAGLIVNPFQYRAETGELHIGRRLSFRLQFVAIAGDEASRSALRGRYSEVERAAAGRYINTFESVEASDDESWTRGEGVAGSLDNALLIVVPDAWVDEIAAFATWKRQRGFATFVSRYPSDTGSGASALKAHIAGQYALFGISHIILVGDSGDIPVGKTSPHPSDTVYTLLEGDDVYHDAFISRIAVQTPADLQSQLQKFLTYERHPDAGDAAAWYTRALFVASNEGATKSAFKMNDREILALERDKLLTGGYTGIDQIYDPGASRSATIAAWNQGRSYVLYLGHGEYTSWRTTGFKVDDAWALTNGSALPMVVNGSCYNGNFTLSYESLGEAMMRGGGGVQPGGAIGVVAATTAADWDPPIVLLREFNDLIVADSPLGVGAFSFLAIQAAMDYCYATPGEGAGAATKLMEQMHLLGDCTLGLRTRTPFALDVSHPPVVVAENNFSVTVAQADGTGLADVVVSLVGAGEFQIVGLTDGNGEAFLAIPQIDESGIGEELLLTAYSRNAIAFQTTVSTQPAQVMVYTPSTLPAGFVDEAYSFTLQAAGGVPPYAWELAPGAPAWLDLHPSTGVLAGLPDVAGDLNFTIVVGDRDGDTDEQLASLRIGRPVAIEKTAPPAGRVGEPYASVFVAEGSFPPYVFSLPSGTLPPGVVLAADGGLAGTPEQAGDYDIVVDVVDQEGRRDSYQTVLLIEPSPVISINAPETLPSGNFEQGYSYVFAAEGGSGSGYRWRLADGSLPDGLSLSETGWLTGTPVEWGAFEFIVEVEDDFLPAHIGQGHFTLRVERPVRFATLDLPAGEPGVPYAAQLTADGSYTPFLFQQLSVTDEYTVGEAPASVDGQPTSPPTWIGDEREWELDFPFPFPFHGNLYTSCRVGDNGYLILAGASPSPMWEATAENFQDLVMIAPFWNDQYMTAAYEETGIWLAESANSIHIRWAGRDYHSQSERMQFGVTLHRDGRIDFHYGVIETTNRTVIGIVAGAGTAQILASHVYNPTAPEYLTGWDHHPDVLFTPPLTTVDWLQVAVDGALSGIPPLAGVYQLSVKVIDSQGYQDTRTFPLHVAAIHHPADTSGDGDVDNAELLAFIEDVAAGRFPESELATAIELWQNPPPAGEPRGGGEATGGSGMAANRWLPAAGYIPGRPAILRYAFSHQAEPAPKAMIFGELGGGLEGGEAFAMADGLAQASLPMRLDANGVYWLVRQTPLDELPVYARFSTPDGSRGNLQSQAVVQTIQGSDWMTGEPEWPVAAAEQITRAFKPGWNLLAVPLVLVDPSVPGALAGLDFESPVWQWTGDVFEPAATIQPGEAYWVRCLANQQIVFWGWRETEILKPTALGWRLTGAFSHLHVEAVAGIDNAWLWDADNQHFQRHPTIGEDAPGWLYLPQERLLDLRF